MSGERGVTVSGLTKRFADVVAVDDISFDAGAGTVFAFVGTNGAGKSTTIGCLTTIVRADAVDRATLVRRRRPGGDDPRVHDTRDDAHPLPHFVRL